MVTAPQENRKPGENPGWYRRCMRGGATLDESRSLGKPEKAVWSLGCASQKNCLNEGKTQGSAKYGACGFLLRKNGCSSPIRGCCSFCFSAHQLNITDTIGSGDPVRNRNNRPLLCLAFAISQRACPIVWVYHALTGEVQPKETLNK